jgi:hypothetical protein
MKNCPQILQINADFGLDSFPMPREAESHNQPSIYYYITGLVPFHGTDPFQPPIGSLSL